MGSDLIVDTDLQINGYLRGDEVVGLVNLSREPIMRFRLSGVRPKITITRWTVPPDEWIEQNSSEDSVVSLEKVPTTEEQIKTVLDTLVLVPDEGIFYEVFRGVCLVANIDILEVAQVKIMG